jgi:putative hemolysin
VLLVQVPRAVRGLSGAPQPQNAVTDRDLEYLIELGAREGSLDAVKEQLLSSVLAFTEVLVKEIMIPRTQVVALDEGADFDEVIKLVTESELSRIPVYRDTMDSVVGVLYAKSLLADVRKGVDPKTFQLARYLRKPYFVPEVMKVSRLLTEMQRRKTHLAVVVDEFGGTSGIVTLEDVVEQIVGDINDESDVEEKHVKILGDGQLLADAQVSLRELEEHLGIEFPENGDYETLGGFLTATAGRVPPTGSLVVWNGLSFAVKLADERRVHKVEIARKPGVATDKAPERLAERPAVEKARLAGEKPVVEKPAEQPPPPDKLH